MSGKVLATLPKVSGAEPLESAASIEMSYCPARVTTALGGRPSWEGLA